MRSFNGDPLAFGPLPCANACHDHRSSVPRCGKRAFDFPIPDASFVPVAVRDARSGAERSIRIELQGGHVPASCWLRMKTSTSHEFKVGDPVRWNFEACAGALELRAERRYAARGAGASNLRGRLLCFAVPFRGFRRNADFNDFGKDPMRVGRLLHCFRLRIMTILDHRQIPSQLFE